jgi:hypothetical protein
MVVIKFDGRRRGDPRGDPRFAFQMTLGSEDSPGNIPRASSRLQPSLAKFLLSPTISCCSHMSPGSSTACGVDVASTDGCYGRGCHRTGRDIREISGRVASSRRKVAKVSDRRGHAF